MTNSITWRRFTRDILVVLGIVAAGAYWTFLTVNQGLPVDAHAYWAADSSHLYDRALRGETTDAYLYTPAFEFVVGWLRWLPFEVFIAILRAILLVVLVWLAGPFTIFVLFTLPVASEVNAGNIQILLAAAIVIGFRCPGMWAFVLLTKVTPGVGLIWFAIQRRWRALALAISATAVIGGLSFLAFPAQWLDYVSLVTGQPAPSVAPYYLPLGVRIGPAFALIAWAGLSGKRWPAVVGSTLALPVYYVISSSMLIGVLPFARQALGRSLDRHFAGVSADEQSGTGLT